jgi:hypothetical protein
MLLYISGLILPPYIPPGVQAKAVAYTMVRLGSIKICVPTTPIPGPNRLPSLPGWAPDPSEIWASRAGFPSSSPRSRYKIIGGQNSSSFPPLSSPCPKKGRKLFPPSSSPNFWCLNPRREGLQSRRHPRISAMASAPKQAQASAGKRRARVAWNAGVWLFSPCLLRSLLAVDWSRGPGCWNSRAPGARGVPDSSGNSLWGCDPCKRLVVEPRGSYFPWGL